LVDDHLELTSHSRMDLGLEAEILNRVKDQSYQTTIEKLDKRVNRAYGQQSQSAAGNLPALTQNKKTIKHCIKRFTWEIKLFKWI